MSPPQYFEESPFLFWAIVCTGARKHPKDPSLLERASKILMGLALKSLYSMEDPIPSIKAVLLLLLWPLPMTTTYKDPSFAFSGAAMQLAIQGGLHVAGHAQDYSQTKHRFSESEQNARSRLWIQCVIAMQRLYGPSHEKECADKFVQHQSCWWLAVLDVTRHTGPVREMESCEFHGPRATSSF